MILNIGADIIAGFPGETDENFADTLALIDDFGITQLHAFPFSGHVDHYSVPAGVFQSGSQSYRTAANKNTFGTRANRKTKTGGKICWKNFESFNRKG